MTFGNWYPYTTYCFRALDGACPFGSINCSLRHDIFRCSCGLVMPERERDPHERGRRHRERMQEGYGRQETSAEAPQRPFATKQAARKTTRPRHVDYAAPPEASSSSTGGTVRRGGGGGSAHYQPPRAAAEPHLPSTSTRRTPQSSNSPRTDQFSSTSTPKGSARGDADDLLVQCATCRTDVFQSQYVAHADQHARRTQARARQTELNQAADDKEGVTVQARSGVDFGIIDGNTIEEGKGVELDLRITANKNPVCLLSWNMKSDQGNGSTGFSARLRGKGRAVSVGGHRSITIAFHPPYPGRHEDTLELVFANLVTNCIFVIHRSVQAIVGSKEDHEALQAVAPYKKRKHIKFKPVHLDDPSAAGSVVVGLRPPQWSKSDWKTPLPMFRPPVKLLEAAYGKGDEVGRMTEAKALARVKKFMPAVFNVGTYASFFQTLLYLEDERMRLDLEMYALYEVKLTPDHPRYILPVAGLAENRPSVLVGDYILISESERPEAPYNHNRRWFQGCVHRVMQDSVSLRFPDSFSTYKGNTWDVRFVLNRIPFRRMHSALLNGNNQERILFPTEMHVRERGMKKVGKERMEEIVPFYRSIGADEEQLETVAAIVDLKPGSVPFILFGPPGTGKTVTLVEAMQQLLDKDPNVRILACAPNNSAADLIATKLMPRMTPSTMLRLNSPTRRFQDMPKSLRPFAIYNDNDTFATPTLDQLAPCRIIVSTCLSGGIPGDLGLPRGHFTHIFIDEAGQGKEPEVLLPIKKMADEKKTNVILAGDKQQLGPVVHSNLARLLGLKKSYLERLMERDVYDLKKWRGVTIVKLVKNFRSHPDILRFSNEQFYDAELQAAGDPAITRCLETYERLPKTGFPVLFHGIVGKDEQESKSPSFFNKDEATLVKEHCQALLGNRKKGLTAEHIGIITPYHAQRLKISSLLMKDPKTRDIKVGSVEEFQGQERRVIIMSTVRSNTNYVVSDIRRSLGFVADPKRLNVALTRARSLLIIIGNPLVLSLDPIWRGLLNYIHKQGGWRGKAIDWDPEATLGTANEYEAQRRSQIDGEVDETLQRVKSMIRHRLGEDGYTWDDLIENDGDEDEEGVGAFERPILREAE